MPKQEKTKTNLGHKTKSVPRSFIVVLKVISVLRMRQSLALGITKLISAGVADFSNFIKAFPRRSQGTIGKVFGGQRNLAHYLVAQPKGTGFHSRVVVLGHTLFEGGIVHACLVTTFFNEVKVQGQLPIVGFTVIVGGLICGLANLYRANSFGTKGKGERRFSCGGAEGGPVGPKNLWE